MVLDAKIVVVATAETLLAKTKKAKIIKREPELESENRCFPVPHH